MENSKKLEEMVASWYKEVPHLPKNGQKWLAQNAWWLTLVGIIVCAFGIFGLLSLTFFAGAFLTGIGGGFGAVLGGLLVVAVLVSILFSIITIVLGGMAISPLKAMQKKGWNLLFYIMLLNVVALAVSFLFHLDFLGLVWGLLMAAVGTYFLFEIRGYYGKDRVAKKASVTTSVPKKA